MISNISLVSVPLLQRPGVYHPTKEDRMTLQKFNENSDQDDDDQTFTQSNFIESVEIQEPSNSDSDLDEFTYEQDDVPLLICRSADLGYIDVLVFNRSGDFYLHHNYQLPFLPFCAISVPVVTQKGAFVAVAGTTQEIEFFDLNILDEIHCNYELGGFKRIKDMRGKHKQIPLPNSHESEVISLSISKLHPNVLASSGEDGVKLWDLNTGNFLQDVCPGLCPAVKWSNVCEETLCVVDLTSRQIRIYNFASNQSNVIVQNSCDIEAIELFQDYLIYSDDDGYVGLCKQCDNGLINKVQVFEGAKERTLTALSVSDSGIVLAGSPEVEKVAILRIANNVLELIGEYDSRPAFSAQFLPNYDEYACVLGHGDGTVTLFQVFSRLGVENIKGLVEKPEEYMQMKDISLVIERICEEGDENE